MAASVSKTVVTLGMFIIDQFEFRDGEGNLTGESRAEAIGGGGTYCAIGARIWLPPSEIGMIVDRGHDFPPSIQSSLLAYGNDMWYFRDDNTRGTTRAVNLYRGEHRGFEYLTPRVRITPLDLPSTPLAKPSYLHFICSPKRAMEIVKEIRLIDDWDPVTIYEPIPDRCVPEELASLKEVLSSIDILSPNAEESLSLLSIPLPPTPSKIEQAASTFLSYGLRKSGKEGAIIRSGALGAYVLDAQGKGKWIEAYWKGEEVTENIVDVTGAGNAFLGGLSAGLKLSSGDIFEATLYATVSAGYTVEQSGLPVLSMSADQERWNGDDPNQRLEELRTRLKYGLIRE